MNTTSAESLRLRTVSCGLALFLAACGDTVVEAGEATEAEAGDETNLVELDPSGQASVGPVDVATIAERVDSARERLQETAAGQLIWQSIEAHGGLETWLRQGTLAFDFNYRPVGRPAQAKYTRQRIDIGSARAVHEELGEGADARFGWDGEQAWIVPGPEAFPSTARFWALTPYYFVGMPFVMGDPGVQLELLPDAEVDGARYQLVRATYESGTGDSPDDYYVLYLDPETHRVTWLRYVVSFPGFFADGGHSPEKIMRYLDLHSVNGLRIAQRLETFNWNAETQTLGELVTATTVSGVTFGDTVPLADFSAPEGASTSSEIEFEPR